MGNGLLNGAVVLLKYDYQASLQDCSGPQLLTAFPSKPGGQDSQIVLPDLSAKIDTSYLLKTDDASPAYICIQTKGWRTGPREVLEALADPVKADTVDPSTYSFRLYISMETGDERYDFLNTQMWIGSGVRQGAKGSYSSLLQS